MGGRWVEGRCREFWDGFKVLLLVVGWSLIDGKHIAMALSIFIYASRFKKVADIHSGF